MEFKMRNRRRLRNKETKALEEEFSKLFGKEIKFDDFIDSAEIPDFKILICKNEVIGLIHNDKKFLSLRGILKFKPQKKFIVVDMGAVKFIYNRADVFGKGVVDCDKEIKKDEFVFVVDEKNRQPLAVGIALVNGNEMVKAEVKVVKTIHNIGDKIWGLEV